jgi:cytoskeleton protein RodZ
VAIAAVTLGEVLAAKRGERGLTIEQASTGTSIRAHYLSALESNELERRVSLVYAKGHLTTYARYLGLDPEPLVRLLRSEATPATRTARLALLAEGFRAYAWRKLHPR